MTRRPASVKARDTHPVWLRGVGSRRTRRAAVLLMLMVSLGCRDEPDPAGEDRCSGCDDVEQLTQALAGAILDEGQATQEILSLLEPLVPELTPPASVASWERERERLRRRFLDEVVLRGEAVRWAAAPSSVQWLEVVEGRHHRVRKLRYEILPGLFVPALLYEPKTLPAAAPVVLHLNRHGRRSDMASFDEQARCINLARRGVISLDVEWFGQGLLRTSGFRHTRMNQLDLVGTSGLAPFWLLMHKGLDVLLSHPSADRGRVAVTGLSGGGWQTIALSALDPRVTAANPVAGYAALSTRLAHEKDLGDSEQSPSDAFRVLEFTHLTAMLAPRPLLLTYNAKDDCCFRADRALSPLLDAARPFYALYGHEEHLTSHVNHEPGTHNYKADNRRALYRFLADHFWEGKDPHDGRDLDVRVDVLERKELYVALPEANHDFHSLALDLLADLPARPLPDDEADVARWQLTTRARLRALTRMRDVRVTEVVSMARPTVGSVKAEAHELRLDNGITVPVLELSRGGERVTAIVIGDDGRRSLAERVSEQLAAGRRVLALDLLHVGERQLRPKDWIVSLLVAGLGERSLGLAAGELAAVAGWSREALGSTTTSVVTDGPRSSVAALVAAATTEAIDDLSLGGVYPTLADVIRKDLTVEHAPELFAFGLLAEVDVRDMIALVAPRPVRVRDADEHARRTLSELPRWYALLGRSFDPTHR